MICGIFFEDNRFGIDRFHIIGKQHCSTPKGCCNLTTQDISSNIARFPIEEKILYPTQGSI
jgi:hypothetical protein